jgi:hypothetical protein
VTTTFRAHFDGKTIQPDEPVELAPGTALLITPIERVEKPSGKGRFSKFGGMLSDEEASQMRRVIAEEFERIEGEW